MSKILCTIAVLVMLVIPAYGQETATTKYLVKNIDVATYFYYTQDGVLKYRHFVDGDNEYWEEYTPSGALMRYKHKDGSERTSTFDAAGNEVSFTDSSGFSFESKYDKDGNKIYYKDSNGEEWWREYNENREEVYFKSGKVERRVDATEEGNKRIQGVDSKSKTYTIVYDAKGQKASYTDSAGKSWMKSADSQVAEDVAKPFVFEK